MTLDDAKVKQVETNGRIIREPNQHGYVEVWFTVGRNNKLMVNTVEYRKLPNPYPYLKPDTETYILTREAVFQTSSHTDWIVI